MATMHILLVRKHLSFDNIFYDLRRIMYDFEGLDLKCKKAIGQSHSWSSEYREANPQRPVPTVQM